MKVATKPKLFEPLKILSLETFEVQVFEAAWPACFEVGQPDLQLGGWTLANLFQPYTLIVLTIAYLITQDAVLLPGKCHADTVHSKWCIVCSYNIIGDFALQIQQL